MNLKTVQTPALLLDLDKFTRNCNWMKEKAERLHVALRPHLKTGKCIEFAKVQMTSPSGPATVSTLLEAEYFFNLGVIDLIPVFNTRMTKRRLSAPASSRVYDFLIS